jgi:hypothetical protein
MTPTETAQVIAYIEARLGRKLNGQRNPLQVEAWHDDLARYEFTDALAAARNITSAPGVITLAIGDLLAGIRKIRNDRIDRLGLDPVPDADPNDPAAYIAALRDQRKHLASTTTTKEITA